MNKVSPFSPTAALVPLLVLFLPLISYADAIVPSLVLIWPITFLLLIPIVLVEASYFRARVDGMKFWKSVRLMGVANVLSTLAGLPLAYGLASGLQYGLEAAYFRDPNKLQRRAAEIGMIDPGKITRHDYGALIFFGLYPRWILLLSAAVMVTLSFLISWWVEGKWVQRGLSKAGTGMAEPELWSTVRNANLMSYAFVVLILLWALSM